MKQRKFWFRLYKKHIKEDHIRQIWLAAMAQYGHFAEGLKRLIKREDEKFMEKSLVAFAVTATEEEQLAAFVAVWNEADTELKNIARPFMIVIYSDLPADILAELRRDLDQARTRLSELQAVENSGGTKKNGKKTEEQQALRAARKDFILSLQLSIAHSNPAEITAAIGELLAGSDDDLLLDGVAALDNRFAKIETAFLARMAQEERIVRKAVLRNALQAEYRRRVQEWFTAVEALMDSEQDMALKAQGKELFLDISKKAERQLGLTGEDMTKAVGLMEKLSAKGREAGLGS